MTESVPVMCVQIPGSVSRAENTSVQKREFRVGVQLVQFRLRGEVLQLDWDGSRKRSRQDSELSKVLKTDVTLCILYHVLK